MPNVRRRRRRGEISGSPAIGPGPVCRRPSKGRSDPATGRPISLVDRDRGKVMNHVVLEPKSSPSAVDDGIEAASAALIALQKSDGHWVFELEADATIPAEYILLRHYLGEPVDAALERKIAAYLRRVQGKHGGWPLFRDGAFDMSASVKAYFALKMTGEATDAA